MLKKLLIFLLPLIVFFGYLEIRLATLQNAYSIKKQNLESLSTQIKILVLGDSTSFYGINPQIWPIKGYNLANRSQAIYYDYELLKKYLPKLPNLNLVIIPISYITLEYDLIDTPEKWRGYYYLRTFDIPNSKLPLYDLKRYSWLALYSPGKVKTFIAKMFRVNLAENISPTGWYMDKLNNPKTDLSGKERVELHHQIMNSKSINKNIQILEDIIQLTKQSKVNIALITLPVNNTYSKNISSDKYQTMQDTIRRIINKYNVRYFNYFFDNRFNTNDFVDNDHLNINGANKFTKIINEEILSNFQLVN